MKFECEELNLKLCSPCIPVHVLLECLIIEEIARKYASVLRSRLPNLGLPVASAKLVL